MTDLAQSLQGRDFGHLKIIAGLWHLEINAPDFKNGLLQLVPQLTDAVNFQMTLESLPEKARLAIHDLVENGGRITWSRFTRLYGEVREMGPAQRDRVQPYLVDHASVAEALWYRAIIGRAFFDTPAGLQEFAFIPEEVFAFLLGSQTITSVFDAGRQASSAEKAYVILAVDSVLDDSCTFLAGLRMGLSTDQIQSSLTCGQNSIYPLTTKMLKALLEIAGILETAGPPRPEKIREFLEAPPPDSLLWLVRGWIESPALNELRMLPGLVCEGEWQNDPLAARKTVLDFLNHIPGGAENDAIENSPPFWSLNAFLAAIKQHYPDFQRSSGDYDTWFISRLEDGKNLRGFDHWDEVDGELIKFIIGGPLFWLGLVDLGFARKPEAGEKPQFTSFRFSSYAHDLLALKAPAGLPGENKKLIVKSDGVLVAPRLLARSVRYQIARFCDWEAFSRGDYVYRLSTRSLARARQQSLQIAQLLSLINRYAQAVPANLVKALKRWDQQRTEVLISQETILRVKRPEILQVLRTSRASRFLGEQLGPVSIIVHAGGYQKVVNELISMGYFSEIEIDTD